MERHGLPGVAALKIITKHFKTLLFEVQTGSDKFENKA